MSKARKPVKTRDIPQPAATPPAWLRFFKSHGWPLAALWALVLVAYSNSFQSGLVFDNYGVLAMDPRIRATAPENLAAVFTEGYWHVNSASGLYRPLTTLSYLFNDAILGDGLQPPGYHWINLALHLANVSLVYALGLVLLSEWALAFALAALWGLHPLLTESVTNIIGRADLLAGFGVLAGLLAYIRGLGSSGAGRNGWFVVVIAAQAIGLFSKENAAVLPGLMLLYDLLWPSRATWRVRAPMYAALALPFAAFFWVRSTIGAHLQVAFAENPLVRADFLAARLTAIKIIGRSLGLFLWPVSLSNDYSFNSIPVFSWSGAQVAATLLALALCLALLAAGFLWRTKLPAAAFFIGFFFVALLPTSNLLITIGAIMAERFLYLPAIGLAGLVVLAIYAVAQRFGNARIAWVATAAICLALAARTYARNSDWRDDLTLWSSAVRVSPDSARAHNALGNALDKAGRRADAVAEYRAALRIRPDYAEAHLSLGNALLADGHIQDAIAEYQASLKAAPDYSRAHNGLGIALLRIPGRDAEARAEFETAVRINPELAEAHANLANSLAKIPGRMNDAVPEWQTAERLNPDIADPHYRLAQFYAQTSGHNAEAIAEYEAAVSLQPDLVDAHYALGNLLLQNPATVPQAVNELHTAVRLRPDFAEAHNNLANALAQNLGTLQQAIAEWQTAIHLRPDMVEAHYNLGNALSEVRGRLPDAIAEVEAAYRLRPDPQIKQTLDRLRAQAP